MARSTSRSTATGNQRQIRALVTLLVVACCLAPHAVRTFTSPQLGGDQAVQTRRALTGAGSPFVASPSVHPSGRSGVTATEAVAAGVGAKVLNAMSAGAVAAVVQALLSSVTEPIVNRVLVKRMAVKDAIAEMTPSMIASFFTTTISTNLIKFPLFEAVAMFVSLLPDMNNAVKGLIVGFIFTTATLPITNFRYRMSIQTPAAEALKPSMLYQAYAPTVVRDMVYAIARGFMTAALLVRFSGLAVDSPVVLFSVVLVSCIISAPFNEIRGFLLQSAGKKLTFGEFFKPINFVRSTSLGALNQAIALGVGYGLTPIVGRALVAVSTALNAGSWRAFFILLAALDVLVFLISKAVSRQGVMSDRLLKQLERVAAVEQGKDVALSKYEAQIKSLKEQNEKMIETEELKDEVAALKELIKTKSLSA